MNPRSAHARKIVARRAASRRDDGSFSPPPAIVAAMTPTGITATPLYLVDAVRPAMTPATAHLRSRVGALMARFKHTIVHSATAVIGTSVTPKCESRTCRYATAKKKAA